MSESKTERTRTPEENTVRYWIRRNATRKCNYAIWAGIAVVLLVPDEVPYVNWAVAAFVVGLNVVAWQVGKRVEKKLEETFEKVSADHTLVTEVHRHFAALPTRDRTMGALQATLNGDGPKDGLNCYERGRHVLGCPHRQLSVG